MGLGNLDSSVRNLPVARSFIQFATYPSIPKKPSTKIGKTHIKDWGANKEDVLQQMFALVVKDLPKLYEEGIEINCRDGKKRTGNPILGGYICDHKECETLFQVNADSCYGQQYQGTSPRHRGVQGHVFRIYEYQGCFGGIRVIEE